jgi:DNA-binding NtrC family response regulator|tara:strand:+ start:233 stop:511 length:279 start_codon:yes stop_codon:yes gene_type:complete
MGATMQVSINIEGATIEVIEGLIETAKVKNETILNQNINENFNLKTVMAEVARHYLERAIEYREGNMVQVARDLGLNDTQTAKNWARKYGAW